jgi:hypothetical protein
MEITELGVWPTLLGEQIVGGQCRVSWHVVVQEQLDGSLWAKDSWGFQRS